MSFSIESDFNEDCLLEIFSYLSLDDMMQVKRVCKKWYQISQQWFKQVQTLVYRDDDMGNGSVQLYEKNHKRKIYEETNTKKFTSILHLYGHHIKYLDAAVSEEWVDPTEERKKFIFQTCPKFCKNIVKADLYVVPMFYTPSTFDNMAKYWKKLEHFEIYRFYPPVEKSFLKMLQNNQQMKTFSFAFIPECRSRVGDRIFTYLPPTIRKIKIKSMSVKGTKQLSHFRFASKNFTSLQSLTFSGLRCLFDNVIAAIVDIKSITHLKLCNISCYESRRKIETIANLKSLRSLNLSHNRDLIEDCLINIVESCVQLEHLNIDEWELLTDKGISAIAKLEKLKILYICAKNVSNNSIVTLPNSLELLVCRQSEIYDTNAIKFLQKATNLSYVKFDRCNNLTKVVLEAANEIANRRKRNILCIDTSLVINGVDDIDTPYFKYSKNKELPREIFPEYVRNHLNHFYCL